MIKLKSILVSCLAFILFGFPLLLHANDALKLEVSLEDPQDPSQSIAIINGESVKEKERVGAFEITRILSSSVSVRNIETGEESILMPHAPPPAEAPKIAAADSSPSPSQPKQNAVQAIFQTPGKMVNRFWEMRALRDLVLINNAAVSYFNQKTVFPKSMSDLISSNFLPAAYSSGVKEKYRFYLIVPPDPKDFGIHADPVDPSAGLRYFYVGTDTVIRESQGSPAGPKSQPHAY